MAFAGANDVAHTIEIRLDCLEASEFEKASKRVTELIGERPVIITLRPAEQGGQRELDHETRQHFWSSAASRYRRASLDIELDLAESFTERAETAIDWNRVICSHHDFTGVAGDLDQIYKRMLRTPARILKIAVQADDVTDCIPIFDLLERARREGREMIAIAMGTAGIATRILGPSRGAFLTYGALETDRATAPGQLTARELRELYRINTITPQTQVMGLAGWPVAHSVSPHMHNAAFAATGIDAVYIPFEVREATAFVRRMVHPRTREIDWNLRGLSVTAPHKTTVMDSLDWIEPAAREIGAVNTIAVVDDALHGYNTDALVILEPVKRKVGSLRNARCAVIGAGGAVSAALWSLRREGARVVVFARDFAKADAAAKEFSASCERLEGARLDEFDLVINATPLGTRGPLENETPVTSHQLRGARFTYDLVYNPIETRFMREAREAGCETIGGLEMLVAQAAEQFKLWTGTDAPIEIMRDAARSALADHNLKSEI